jgi:hypothetical protein
MGDAEETVAPRRCSRLAERALAMEGTCTGEHGVGQGKLKYLESEHGRAALDAMKAVKATFDPLKRDEPRQAHSAWVDEPARHIMAFKGRQIRGFAAFGWRL